MLSRNGRNTRILADDASVPLEWNWEAAWQYGKAYTGTVFRGEEDAFSRITWKYRTPDDGYWDVTTRDGVRYEFGQDDPLAAEPGGLPVGRGGELHLLETAVYGSVRSVQEPGVERDGSMRDTQLRQQHDGPGELHQRDRVWADEGGL